MKKILALMALCCTLLTIASPALALPSYDPATGRISDSYDGDMLSEYWVNDQPVGTDHFSIPGTVGKEYKIGHYLNGNIVDYEVNFTPTSDTPVKTIPNKYSVSVSGVTKSAIATDGTGTVTLVEGNEEIGSLYIRIYWVYTLSDDSSMAYAALKPVTVEGVNMTFDTTSPSAPFGATLDEVQFALVNDPKADRSPTYTSVGGTKPIVVK